MFFEFSLLHLRIHTDGRRKQKTPQKAGELTVASDSTPEEDVAQVKSPGKMRQLWARMKKWFTFKRGPYFKLQLFVLVGICLIAGLLLFFPKLK